MKFNEFGLILFVEKYKDCIAFYRDVLRLNIIAEKETLVKFELPTGYLMVEKGGVGSDQEKLRNENQTVLRFDVESLESTVEELEKRGVQFIDKKLTFEWGAIAVLNDPDGNRIELGEIF